MKKNTKVIAICSFKGGTGKTLLSLTINNILRIKASAIVYTSHISDINSINNAYQLDQKIIQIQDISILEDLLKKKNPYKYIIIDLSPEFFNEKLISKIKDYVDLWLISSNYSVGSSELVNLSTKLLEDNIGDLNKVSLVINKKHTKTNTSLVEEFSDIVNKFNNVFEIDLYRNINFNNNIIRNKKIRKVVKDIVQLIKSI